MQNRVLGEITAVSESMGEAHYARLADAVKKAGQVFVAGTGRSGLIGRCFAMRLRHLGMESFTVGETACPPIRKNGLLILISFSGDRKSLLELAEISRKQGAAIICITGNRDNPLAKASGDAVIIPACQSSQFGNSLFEQAAFIFLETFTEYYRRKEKISRATMIKKHANLE